MEQANEVYKNVIEVEPNFIMKVPGNITMKYLMNSI